MRVRFADMRSVTRSTTLSGAISATSTLTEVAVSLARSALDDHPGEKAITLLANSVAHLVDQSALQLEFSLGLDDDARRPGSERGLTRWVVDRSADAVRQRFGRDAIGYATVILSDAGSVPAEFRELAEHDVR